MGLCAGRGPRRFVGGGRCMGYPLPVSAREECGGGAGKGREGGVKVPRRQPREFND